MPEHTLPASHRAWTWQSGPQIEDLRLDECPLPQPGFGQVLVRNRVIGLNPVDWKVLGAMGDDWQAGHVPGVDGAGEVVALGLGVPTQWLGQRVAYHTDLRRHGSFADYTPVDARALLRLPDPLPFTTAASVPCPALTAWMALDKLPQPAAPHHRLLISGAGGAVGHYLVQLATQRGWQVSIMSHDRHWTRLRLLGASQCRPGPLPPEASGLADDARFHAIIDCINASHAAQLVPALAANGHLVCIQGRLEQWPCPPFGRALSLHEVALGALHVHGDDADWAALTHTGERLLQALADGQLTSEAWRLHAMEELGSALASLKQRSFSGKLLVQTAS